MRDRSFHSTLHAIPKKTLTPISAMHITEPGVDDAPYLLKLTIMSESDEAVFEVPRRGYRELKSYISGKSQNDDLWRDIVMFLEVNSFLPTEAVSLYKYVKGLLERSVAEKLAQSVIDHVDLLHLESVLSNPERALGKQFQLSGIGQQVGGASALDRMKTRMSRNLNQDGIGPTKSGGTNITSGISLTTMQSEQSQGSDGSGAGKSALDLMKDIHRNSLSKPEVDDKPGGDVEMEKEERESATTITAPALPAVSPATSAVVKSRTDAPGSATSPSARSSLSRAKTDYLQKVPGSIEEESPFTVKTGAFAGCSPQVMCDLADLRLAAMEVEVKNCAVGDLGVPGAVLEEILLRNVEKMRHINRVLVWKMGREEWKEGALREEFGVKGI